MKRARFIVSAPLGLGQIEHLATMGATERRRVGLEEPAIESDRQRHQAGLDSRMTRLSRTAANTRSSLCTSCSKRRRPDRVML